MVSYEKPGEEPLTFREERMQFADTSIFKVFDFKLLQGNPDNCLKGTNKVLVSESTARKYFRDEDPIGKRLSFIADQFSLEVTGVFEDVLENSSFQGTCAGRG